MFPCCVRLVYQKHDEDFSLHFLDFTAFPAGLSHVCPLRNLRECELLVILEILWLRLLLKSFNGQTEDNLHLL